MKKIIITASMPHLFACKELDKINQVTVARSVNSAIKRLWERFKIILLLTVTNMLLLTWLAQNNGESETTLPFGQ